ncbi:MAG TPA: nucleoside-diphosphate kinase [Candidatus Cloacimonadota bacterium]|nr:nucleoside-diphosphate kinase [Candidatus Cloacimonadota bacterium]
MSDKTLLLIKPNAIMHKHAGEIISMVESQAFVLRDIKILKFTQELAASFYLEHKGKEFYDRLLAFMCSGPTIALLLEKHDAVSSLRELVGDTDPAKRKTETIRYRFAEGITENAVHASDSPEHAKREIRLIFGYNPT